MGIRQSLRCCQPDVRRPSLVSHKTASPLERLSILPTMSGNLLLLPKGIYGTWLLFFVSARTNKRHHHHKRFGDCCGVMWVALAQKGLGRGRCYYESSPERGGRAVAAGGGGGLGAGAWSWELGRGRGGQSSSRVLLSHSPQLQLQFPARSAPAAAFAAAAAAVPSAIGSRLSLRRSCSCSSQRNRLPSASVFGVKAFYRRISRRS